MPGAFWISQFPASFPVSTGALSNGAVTDTRCEEAHSLFCNLPPNVSSTIALPSDNEIDMHIVTTPDWSVWQQSMGLS